MAHGARQIVWGGLLLAVAAEVVGAVEGQPQVCRRQLPWLRRRPARPLVLVVRISASLSRLWKWRSSALGRGLDAFHMMCHRKHIEFGGSRSDCQLGDLRIRLPAPLHPRAQLVETCPCHP